MGRADVVAERRRQKLAANALISATETAELLGISPGTLANWRVRGFGPTYLRLGRLVKYRWPDVESWLRNRESASADDSRAATT